MARRGGSDKHKNKDKELSRDDYKRELKTREKIPDIIIACEDEISSPTYFKMIISNLIQEKIITQDSFVIANHKHSNPKGVLKDLTKHKADNGKKYKDFEHKWIVIDRDIERVNGGGHNKEDFNNALKDAKELKVEVAYANDSFELWYLLHFDYRNTAILRDEILEKVISKLKKISEKFTKLDEDNIKTEKYTELIFEELLQYQYKAIKNKKKLLNYYGEAHNAEKDNPSTTIHKLVDILNKFDKNRFNYKTEFCQIEYVEELDAVLCSWKKFCSGNDYKKPLEQGLKILKVTNCKTWITDTANGFKSTQEDTRWIEHTLMPQVLSTTCRNLFFIMKEDSELKDEIDEQSKILGESLNVKIYESIDELKRDMN